MAAKNGYQVAVGGLANQGAQADAVVAEIVKGGGKAITVLGDVTSENDIEAIFAKTKSELGPVDGVVNAAGVAYGAPVADLQFANVDWMMRINVTGLIICCREAVRQMQGRGGSIVNISSMAATIGGRPGAAAYAASKAAVDSFTTGAARDLAIQKIRMNTIRPGVVASPMTERVQNDPVVRRRIEESIPMGRLGQPEEIAAIAIWLLSDAASLVTGAHINAGGGGFQVASAA
jgi:NAD(P)-dependent dehydrogenase (short-subunit alcohol dehydrogenase family)